MKKRRVFIAINLPDYVKKKMLGWQQEWANLPARWTKESSLHITLVFIGYVGDEEMLEICQLVRQIGTQHQPFEIKLERICLGPPEGMPRMIWAEGEKNLALAKLKDDLENALLDSAKSGYNRKEARAFRPHITLARIKQREWRVLPSRPKIEKEISLSFPVESIEVMESQLLRDGAEYTVLESARLGE
jgi:2'-5' RNA ligase